MKLIGISALEYLDETIKYEMNKIINSKLDELEIFYNIKKFDLKSSIDFVEKDLMADEELRSKQEIDLRTEEDLNVSLIINRSILDKKKSINDMKIKLNELDNFYKFNIALIQKIKDKIAAGAYLLDKENITYNYVGNYVPVDIYLVIVFLISLFFISIFFIVVKGYKEYKNK